MTGFKAPGTLEEEDQLVAVAVVENVVRVFRRLGHRERDVVVVAMIALREDSHVPPGWSFVVSMWRRRRGKSSSPFGAYCGTKSDPSSGLVAVASSTVGGFMMVEDRIRLVEPGARQAVLLVQVP
jgi:hypothetical protein